MEMVCHMIASQEQTSNQFAWVKTLANQAKTKADFILNVTQIVAAVKQWLHPVSTQSLFQMGLG